MELRAALATFPQTIYAVSLLYQKGIEFNHFATLICVSGVDPLTNEEVVNRAKAKCPEEFKDWMFKSFAFTKMFQFRQ